jgi:hypothetical protein
VAEMLLIANTQLHKHFSLCEAYREKSSWLYALSGRKMNIKLRKFSDL